MNKNLFKRSLLSLGLLIGIFVLSACNTQSKEGNYASVPAGMAYAEGKEVYFSHTETSDPAIAEKLTKMMRSPVLLVPSLAKASEDMLAVVYVFENGISGKGPLGFQPDVFDNPPGSSGYSPLRRIHLVNWKDASKARLLKSAAEVKSAEGAAELEIKKTDVVVNMPFMVWDGGQR
jgi:hypothetical protein